MVVDTEMVSFLFKSHSRAPAYRAILPGRPLVESRITVAEIEYGMRARTGNQSARIKRGFEVPEKGVFVVRPA